MSYKAIEAALFSIVTMDHDKEVTHNDKPTEN